MLRKITTGVFVLCLAAWCGLALVICMTIIGHGLSAVGPKLLHLAGTNERVRSAVLESGCLAASRASLHHDSGGLLPLAHQIASQS